MRSGAPEASTPRFDPGAPLLSELVALRAVFGQDEANHGTVRYRVDNDGRVRVPREAAVHLLRNGGFVMEPDVALRPSGKAVVHHQSDLGAGLAPRGEPDGDGNWLVEAAEVGELVAHGWVAGARSNEPAADDPVARKIEAPFDDRDRQIGMLEGVVAERDRRIVEIEAQLRMAAERITAGDARIAELEEQLTTPTEPAPEADGRA